VSTHPVRDHVLALLEEALAAARAQGPEFEALRSVAHHVDNAISTIRSIPTS
jgi:hypothetical protein